jgi:protein-L-isoaspartate(D-aspartate) O-methyltransferase
MTAVLEVGPEDRVLEIGTGSGYQTAVLAELAGEVFSIERHEPLARHAAAVLRELAYSNVRLLVGDGTLGYPAEAPYTRILVTAAAGKIPTALCDQLAAGGILVMPVGEAGGQILQVLRKRADGWHMDRLARCRFVPLIGSPETGAADDRPATGSHV